MSIIHTFLNLYFSKSEIQERVVHTLIHTVNGSPEYQKKHYAAKYGAFYLFIYKLRYPRAPISLVK